MIAIEEEADCVSRCCRRRTRRTCKFVGATCDRTVVQGTLVDIGGGSLSSRASSTTATFDNASIGQGSLSSFAQHVRGILPTGAEMEPSPPRSGERFAALPRPDAYRSEVLFGIGGSVRAAAKMHAQATGATARPKAMTKRKFMRYWNGAAPTPTRSPTRAQGLGRALHAPSCRAASASFWSCSTRAEPIASTCASTACAKEYLIDRMLR